MTPILENKKIRRIWHGEEWYFSVIDVVGVLTDSVDAGAYWRKLKQRLNQEGSEVVTFCHGLRLEAADGKKYTTDCANTQSMFRNVLSCLLSCNLLACNVKIVLFCFEVMLRSKKNAIFL